MLAWIDAYWRDGKPLTVTIRLTYFNTSTSKYLFNMIKKLELGFEKGLSVTVNWHYDQDDVDMLESGEEFKDICAVPFQLVQV